jgi:hypothetical protein
MHTVLRLTYMAEGCMLYGNQALVKTRAAVAIGVEEPAVGHVVAENITRCCSNLTPWGR